MSYRGDVTEVRFEAGTSAKFYRVYTIFDEDTKDYRVLYQWGRIGAPKGQCKAETYPGAHAMNAAAWEKLDQKAKKGYESYWSHTYDSIPPDILDMAAVNERSQEVARVKASNDPFVAAANLLDQAMRLTTGGISEQAEAVVVSRTLHDQLDTLKARLLELEGSVEIVDMTIAHKIGLPSR